MSMDKGVEYGKEKRKEYRGAKSIDRTCRNHGSCPWCEGGRQHKHKKNALYAQALEEEWALPEDPVEEDFDEEWYEFDRVMDMAAEMDDNE